MWMSNHWVPVVSAKSATGNLFTHNPPKNNKKSNDDTTKMIQLLFSVKEPWCRDTTVGFRSKETKFKPQLYL